MRSSNLVIQSQTHYILARNHVVRAQLNQLDLNIYLGEFMAEIQTNKTKLIFLLDLLLQENCPHLRIGSDLPEIDL
jgi:hypothetical protein